MSNFPGPLIFFRRKDLLKTKHRGLAISFFIDIIIVLLILSEPIALLLSKIEIIKDEVLLTVSCPIFPSISIAKNLLTGSLKNRSIDNLETQKKSISMKNSHFFDYLLYAKSK